MENFGFIRTAAAVPVVSLANPSSNAKEICRLIGEACSNEVSLIVFPEMAVTGYSCGDLFCQTTLMDGAEKAIAQIAEYTKNKAITAIVGTPVRHRGKLYNCAAVISNGVIDGIIPKIHLPNYNEFYEARWFSSGRDFLHTQKSGAKIIYAGQECEILPNMLFRVGCATVAIEICEDMWSPVPPSSFHALAGANIIVNPSASNEVSGKHNCRIDIVKQLSYRTKSAYIYCSTGWGESSQDTVYGGSALIYENGTLLTKNHRFQMTSSMVIADIDCDELSIARQRANTYEAIFPDGSSISCHSLKYKTVQTNGFCNTDFRKKVYRNIEAHPFTAGKTSDDLDEILQIQATALARRLSHINCKSAVLGISGGLDSTLALLVTAMATDKLGWDRKRIVGITMPGYGTTGRTKSNAEDLMTTLGITSRQISIAAACDRHFLDIGHDKSVHDATFENAQARERTQILMDVANSTNGIVIGTGDMSELALGWATYNGDQMSMYGVNAGVSKTLVKRLVEHIAQTGILCPSDKGVSESADTTILKASQRTVKEILTDILDTPVSPELLPANADGGIAQVTEDLVGPYELHDFFLYNFICSGWSAEKMLFLACKTFEGHNGYTEEIIRKWLKTFIRRFFTQQFKRSAMPDGPKTGPVSLSPRTDLRMPSDACMNDFLENL